MKPWDKASIEQQFAQLHGLHRRQLWLGVLQSIACGVLGLLAGIVFGLGYLADMAR